MLFSVAECVFCVYSKRNYVWKMSMNICISNSSCSSVSIYIFSVYITIYVCDEFIDVLDVIEELNLLTLKSKIAL